jgi:hypothetical protein
VRVVRIPPVIGRYSGITIGRFVCLASDADDDGSSQLMAHELVHVRQWNELGVVGFLVGYLGAFARGLWRERSWHAAYRQIPAEQEAYQLAKHWAERRAGPEERPGGSRGTPAA